MTKRIVRSADQIWGGWLAGILVSLSLLTIGYLTFTANELVQTPKTLRVYLDPDNGCQFVGMHGAIVPRLDSKGDQMGCQE